MITHHKTHYETTIDAPLEKVWKALTDPAIVRQYFFGTDLETDWKVGSPIYFKGKWEGQEYQDKGEVLEYEHQERLAYSYLSNWSGMEDMPENYLWVCYEVKPEGEQTHLTIHQSNYDEEKAQHSNENWASVVDAMKKIVED